MIHVGLFLLGFFIIALVCYVIFHKHCEGVTTGASNGAHGGAHAGPRFGF